MRDKVKIQWHDGIVYISGREVEGLVGMQVYKVPNETPKVDLEIKMSSMDVVDEKPTKDYTLTEVQQIKTDYLNALRQEHGFYHGPCVDVLCKECVMDCQEAYCVNPKWLMPTTEMVEQMLEYLEKPKPVCWSRVPVDTKILVDFNRVGIYDKKRYFAKYEAGRVHFFVDGSDSWSGGVFTTSIASSRVKLAETVSNQDTPQNSSEGTDTPF